MATLGVTAKPILPITSQFLRISVLLAEEFSTGKLCPFAIQLPKGKQIPVNWQTTLFGSQRLRMENNLSDFSDDLNVPAGNEEAVKRDAAEESPIETAEFAVAPAAPTESQSNLASAPVGAEIPPFIGDRFLPMDPRNVNVETIALLILSCVVMAVAVGLLIYVFFSFGIGWLLLGSSAVATVAVIGCLVFAFYWPRLEYKWTRFRFDLAGVEIHHGVLWRHQVCVPIGRVQHADVSQGPLQRMNGVATLTMHTAGTSNASVSLEGLNHQMAIDIRDWIVHQRKSHDAV